MNVMKRIVSAAAAAAVCCTFATGAFAEKFVEAPASNPADKALADEYRTLFSYEEITAEGYSVTLPYRLCVPEDYDPNYAYPVVLFLHGAGESGGDNEKQLNVGMMTPFFEEGFYKKFPCIIVAAQVPNEPTGTTGEWVNVSWKSGSYEIKDMDETGPTFTEEIQLAKKAVEKTAEDYNVDASRIYVTGISMGGYGTWNIITHYSDYFAAAMPICGAGDPSKAEYLMNMPIWCFHGDEDTAVPVSGSRDMYNAITELGGTKINYTEWTGTGHAWLPAYYREDVWQWLFSQSKETVDVSPVSDMAEKLKGTDTSGMTEEDRLKFEYALNFADMVINGSVHTSALVDKAMSLLNEAETMAAAGENQSSVWMIVGISAGAAVIIAAVAVVTAVAVRRRKKAAGAGE